MTEHMVRSFFCLIFFLAAMTLSTGCGTKGAKPDASCPKVVMETSMGNVTIELWPHKAPETVANFLEYVDGQFYDQLIFHRVMPGFVVQAGGFTLQMRLMETRAPVVNEARADTPNERGTLSMARTPDINSATSQFYVNLADNAMLNHLDDSPHGFGYCVFGTVIEGMDVIDAIGKVKTRSFGPMQDVPAQPVVIKSIRKQPQTP